MKKFAVVALSLGLLGALPVAQAAAVSVDGGSFVLSYEDTFLPGSAVSVNAGVVTFSGLAYEALAVGGLFEVNGFYASFNGYAGQPYPIVITPKAGFDIASVTESIGGAFRASAGQPVGQAGAMTGLVSRWVTLNGADLQGQNTPSQLLANLSAGQSAGDAYSVSGSLNIGASGAIALSSLELLGGVGATGQGSVAYLALNQYQIGVRTATAVPEPEVLAMVLAGFGVVGLKLRRSKQA